YNGSIIMDQIDELLTRGVEKIYPSKEELEKVLRSGKKLRLYQGFDPTGTQLHIGHMTGLRKLRQWQDLGHEVIFLLGDFTGMIGDPTGKDKSRIPLTHEQVMENAKTYQEQIKKVLRLEGENPIVFKYNNDWWGKEMKAIDLLKLAHYISCQQLIERDMFQERIKKGMDIAMVEMLYPLIQGYDSIAMDVDLELGGSDQTFNMMIGRDLMHKIKRKNKFVMTTPLLTDSHGNKIGKTEGNIVALTAPANELYGMIMSLGDDVIVKGFEYLTNESMEEVKKTEQAIIKGENPMIYKKKLAHTLTTMLNSQGEADTAQEEFERVHQQGQSPLYDISIYRIQNDQINTVDLLLDAKLASSRSEAKRLIEQGGVEIDNEKLTMNYVKLNLKDGMIIKVGKKKFVKIQLK
ncbi:MAG: tyrosine--tRNA ligase, partial [Candidatus Gottesmanbacteria bacterium]